MRIDRECKKCSKPFTAIKATQFFCSRKCFKQDYALRKRAEKVLDNARVKQYDYSCGICQRRTEMGFNPLKEQHKFAQFICPFCGIPRSIIWQHRYDATFQFGTGTVQYVIQSAIVSGDFR